MPISNRLVHKLRGLAAPYVLQNGRLEIPVHELINTYLLHHISNGATDRHRQSRTDPTCRAITVLLTDWSRRRPPTERIGTLRATCATILISLACATSSLASPNGPPPEPVTITQQSIGEQHAPQSSLPEPSPSDRDVHCLAMTIYTEGRGLTLPEREAFVHVVMNRMAIGNRSVCDVVHERGQFTWTRRRHVPIREPKAMEESHAIASRMLIARGPDTTRGATHFYNPRTESPDWRRRGVETVRYPHGHAFVRIASR